MYYWMDFIFQNWDYFGYFNRNRSIDISYLFRKKQKNIFATIGIIGAVILIVMMVVVLLGIGVYNVGDDALINKVR